VIERARIITGKNINIMDMQRRPGDPASSFEDADKAKRVLHWNTRYSDLGHDLRKRLGVGIRRFREKLRQTNSGTPCADAVARQR